MYIRAVSKSNTEEAKTILAGLDAPDISGHVVLTNLTSIEQKIKAKLNAAGYKVDVSLGNSESKISLAVYDEKLDKYLVGIELDRDAYTSSDASMERDVCKPRFFESRGWSIMRIWSRDWWLYPGKVIKSIIAEAEKNRKRYLASK